MSEKKVVAVIVEGSSDESAIVNEKGMSSRA